MISILLLSLFSSMNADAQEQVRAQDFYCTERSDGKLPVPMQINVKGKGCGDAPGEKTSVCLESVYCTFITRNIKSALLVHPVDGHTHFADLTDKQKSDLFVDHQNEISWLPVILTCTDEADPSGKTTDRYCKEPARCMLDDKNVTAQFAVHAPEFLDQVNKRIQKGEPKIWHPTQPSSETGVAK